MSQKSIRWSQVRHHWEIYLFIVPTLILVSTLMYYPAASGIFHSFFRWNGSDISEFVGLKNYSDMLGSREFWQSFRVALIIGIWNIVKLIPPIVVAVWIHRCSSERMQFFYRLMFVIPMVTPGLVVTLIWRSFFFESTQGYLNLFLEETGLFSLLCKLDSIFGWGGAFVEGVKPAWLGDPRLVLTACIVWGFPWVGSFAVLTFLSKLQSIPKELYEAAEIDGVSWWKKFTKIEVPLILGSIYLMLVFVIIGTIKDAGTVLVLVGIDGGPGGVVTVPALFMLRKAFVSQEMGAACAVGIILTAVVMLLQKVSAVLMEEQGKRDSIKQWLRWFFILIASLLIVSGVWPEIALVVILLALPYGAIGHIVTKIRKHFFKGEERNQTRGFPEESAIYRRNKSFLLRLFKHAGILSVLLAAFVPFYLMLIVSGKTNQQFYESPDKVTQPFHWHNWSDAWFLISNSVANTLIIAIVGTVLTMTFALCGAYFFARVKVPFAGFFWNALLILMMMPVIANMVPLFRLLADMNLLNTLTALILVGTATGQAVAIFVLRNFVADIPHDLFEAAEIDGASHFQQMRMIVLPLCGPIIGTIGVMHFINEWNEFILPLIIMRDASELTVMVQIQRLSGEYVKFFGPLMAGYALASLPIILLFMFTMKLFVKGMTEGGVKG